MNKDERGEARRFLDEIRERLQRDLQALAARPSRGRSLRSEDASAAELKYHLTRLGTALNAIRIGHHSLELAPSLSRTRSTTSRCSCRSASRFGCWCGIARCSAQHETVPELPWVRGADDPLCA